MPQANGASPLLDGLNFEQRQAVTTTEGPVRVIAGPGSGKTRVIIRRIAYLVRELEVAPQSILAVTFTNRAANEMVERLAQAVPPEAARAARVSTFHKFCGLMNRRYGNAIGLDDKYSIYDREDQMTVVKRAMQNAGVPAGRSGVSPGAILSKISFAKSILLSPRQYAELIYRDEALDLDYATEAAADVYHHYQNELLMANALDFDDIIHRAVRILQESESVRERTQHRFRYMMIDEYQDTNHAQNELAGLVAGPRRNLCIVGDPDQSVYGWRNADIRNILEFKQRYPEAKTVRLGRNYRSTKNIVAAAGALIRHNRRRIDNPLTAAGDTGDPIVMNVADDPSAEAEWAVGRMAALVREGQCAWRDCAVIYRLNAQSRPFEETCVRRGVPYRLIGGVRFYQRREVKDLLAYLKVILNPGDTVSLQRIINVPPRKIGAATVNKLLAFAGKRGLTLMQAVSAAALPSPDTEKPDLGRNAAGAVARFHRMLAGFDEAQRQVSLSELVDIVIGQTGLERHVKGDDDGPERWENILELRALAGQDTYARRTAVGSLPDLLERVSLVADVDQYDETEGVLTLITLHQAKGLEFAAVAMPGMNEGTLPHRAGDLEEERRLCYVGVTRAQKWLLMSAPETGGQPGAAYENRLSRFIHEIPGWRLAGE